MNATQDRFQRMTVARLRTIGREMGIAGLSGLRKAELVSTLTVFVNGCHIDALAMDHPRTVVRDGKVSPFDYPAYDGRTVTQAHSNICASKGHAYLTIDGKPSEMCPRCGEMDAPVQPGLITGVKVGDVVKYNGYAAEVITVDTDCIHVASIASHVTYGALKGDFSTDISAEMVEQFNRDCVALAYTSYATGNDSNRAARALARIRGIEADYTTIQGLRREIESNPMYAVLSDTSEIDSAEIAVDAFLSNALSILRTLAVKATAMEHTHHDKPNGDQWITIAKDLNTAVSNVEWSIRYAHEVAKHTCSTWEREVGLSGCAYGCKIYRCEKCGTEREIHNATYGCKG